MSEITNPLNGEVLPCTRETLAAELQTQRVSASGDELTEREIQLTILAVMDALDANVAFADADSDEFKRIIQKLQRNPASGQEPRLEIIERVIKGGGTLKAAWKEIKRVESASGDDELKEALRAHRMASGRWYGQPAGSGTYDAEVWDAETAIESLFGRIREERDRAHGDANEMAGHCIRLREERDTAVAELGRIREAALTPEEALAILADASSGTDDPLYKYWCSAILKLRGISGGALKEGATQ